MTNIHHAIAYKLGELGPFFSLYDDGGKWIETVSNVDMVKVDPLLITDTTVYKTNFNRVFMEGKEITSDPVAPTHK